MRDIVHRYATDSPNPHLLIKKLTLVFDSLKNAANFNEVFGSVLKNVEEGSCCYYYPHEKITLMERSKVVVAKENLKKKTRRCLTTLMWLNPAQENEQPQSGNPQANECNDFC